MEFVVKLNTNGNPFNYFARPQPKDLNLFHVMAIPKNRVVHVSEFVMGVWDGLKQCEISRPEILSQFTHGNHPSH